MVTLVVSMDCDGVIDAFEKYCDLAGRDGGDDVDDDDGEELHAAAAGAGLHQIPLWVISILSMLRLYPQSGIRQLMALSPLNILS